MSLKFKGSTVYALRLVLKDADTAALLKVLRQRMDEAGSLFQNEAVVIDATAVDQALDWETLIAALRQHHLPPIGVVAQGENLDAARAAGLTHVDLRAPTPRPRAVEQAPPPELAPVLQTSPAIAPAAMVVQRLLRSGQRVYARDTDLIVIGGVAHGAEVIADGNIHVYGPLRGRAMAGARGDESARIFALQLDPELVAIAGLYRVMETPLPQNLRHQACVVVLQQEKLDILPLAR